MLPERETPRVVPLGPGDVGRVVPGLVRAFWDYPEAVHLLPDEAGRRRVLPRHLGADAKDSARHGGLDACVQGETVVGAVSWLPAGAYPVSTGRQLRGLLHVVPALPWALGAAREGLRGKDANRERHQRVGTHVWVRCLGADPDHQGKGVGGRLLRHVISGADRQGCGTFLFTATAGNASWYERFGFDVLDVYHPTDTWPKVWALWRPPPIDEH